MARASFDLEEATAAIKAGGVLSAILRVEKGAFYVEFETREAGPAELVKTKGRARRTFREPGQALKVVRELGVATGRFALEEWDVRAPKAKAWTRPDQSAHMSKTHQRADKYAEEEADTLQALAEADDPAVRKIPHAEVMTMLDAAVGKVEKKAKRKARA